MQKSKIRTSKYSVFVSWSDDNPIKAGEDWEKALENVLEEGRFLLVTDNWDGKLEKYTRKLRGSFLKNVIVTTRGTPAQDELQSTISNLESHIVLSDDFISHKRKQVYKSCSLLVLGSILYTTILFLSGQLSSDRIWVAMAALMSGLLIPLCDLLVASYRVLRAYYGFNAIELSELVDFLMKDCKNSSPEGGRRFNVFIRKTAVRAGEREVKDERGAGIGEPVRG